MRFAKYKGPEIGNIEAHNERRKEQYSSNPDVDTSKSGQNIHLLTPQRSYRAEAEKQIAEAGCKTRSDSVRMVEALITASPEFFKKKGRQETVEYFSHALDFIKAHQNPETILSAVVHMDEKTPHMHLCFIPLTEDKRLSAKEIVGNKKKLTQWQDEFWKHMVGKYPELERGKSAGETGRQHIPPQLYKEAVHLNSLRDRLTELLSTTNILNAKAHTREIELLLDKYIPGVEAMKTKLKKYSMEYRELTEKNAELSQQLKDAQEAGKERITVRLRYANMERELMELRAMVDVIPPEIVEAYRRRSAGLKMQR